jgi:signal transduction histidine kinase
MGSNTGPNIELKVDTTEDTLRVSEQRLAVATEALRRAEERAIAGRLALEIMHEVKNPLEALGHLTYLALQDADDPVKVRKYLLLAEEQMANLAHIARQTLSFAQQTERPRAVDLVHVTEAALRIHQRQIEERRIHLVRDLPEGAVAEVFTGEMLQVVSNLIVNALDALPAEGTLRLRVRKRKNEVDFVIADNGHGISPQHSGAIFQPFFTTKGNKGTGLGLALSKRIIERHHGRIRMRSSIRTGKSGTAFKISLPLREIENR